VAQSTHEVFVRDEKIVTGSDRSFGLVMAGAFAAVSAIAAAAGAANFGTALTFGAMAFTGTLMWILLRR